MPDLVVLHLPKEKPMNVKQKVTSFISSHLSMLVLLPCFLLALIVSYDVYKAMNQMNDAYDAEYNAFMSHGILSVVHEIQKERGNTAGFIGSSGSKFTRELNSQRQVVNKAIEKLREKSLTWSLPIESKRILDEFMAEFGQLSSVRTKVDSLDMSLSNALAYFTNINNIGLRAVITASKLSKDQTISSELFSIYNFSSTKESAGIERAVLSNVFSKDRMSEELRYKYVSLLTKQEVYMNEALDSAPAEMYTLLSKVNDGSEVKNVEGLRAAVALKNSNFGVDPQVWFAAATKRIELLKKVEESALSLVDSTAIKVQEEAVIVLVIESIILVFGLVITLALSFAIRVMQKQADKIEEGINTAVKDRDLVHEIDIISHDELGRAAAGINNLTRLFVKDLLEFSSGSKKITTSTHETAVAISQSQTNLVEQKVGVETIASAAEQMSANVKVISDAMIENSSSVSEVVKQSQQGKITVSEAVKVIQLSASDMEKSATSIDELNKRVGNITSMVEMIQGIAEQTNLLALNAAIEAARAGEQGRGFAVVADEVRGLASRTQTSTEEISSLVSELQKESKTAFEIINRSKENALEASVQAGHIEEALDTIVDQIQKVESVTDSVSVNTREQASAINEVTMNISQIFEQATENVAGAEQIAVAASNIAESAMDMDDQIERYKVKEVANL